jgi:hypothetical protein
MKIATLASRFEVRKPEQTKTSKDARYCSSYYSTEFSFPAGAARRVPGSVEEIMAATLAPGAHSSASSLDLSDATVGTLKDGR